MLKINPARKPPTKPKTINPMAASADEAVPGIYTERYTTVTARDKLDQRESLIRRAHRLRMKEFFARATSVT